MQIEWSKGEVLKLTAVGTETEEEVDERVGWQSIVEHDVRKDAQWGSDQEQGGRVRGAGNRAEVSSCGRGVSFRSSDQQGWRTELDLSSGKAFDDRHRSATVGATPERLRFLSGGRVERRRLARKPKWRMRTKPLGSRCSRKRRKNSSSDRVMVFVSLW